MSSKLHRYVGEILKDPIFRLHKIYEEFPVSTVNPNWHSNRHKFDWVIKDLRVVIEVQGQQHKKMVKWNGNTSDDQARGKLEYQIYTDTRKKQAAIDAGWAYVDISFTDIKSGLVTSNWLYDRILQALERIEHVTFGSG